MIPYLRGIIEDATLSLADHCLKGSLLEGRSGEQVIKVIHVGLMVLAVMILKRFSAQMGGEVTGGILQWGEFEFHDLVRLFRINCKDTKKVQTSPSLSGEISFRAGVPSPLFPAPRQRVFLLPVCPRYPGRG